MLQWQQNALMTLTGLDKKDIIFEKNLTYFMHFLPEQKRNSARIRIVEKAHELFANKKGLSFST